MFDPRDQMLAAMLQQSATPQPTQAPEDPAAGLADVLNRSRKAAAPPPVQPQPSLGDIAAAQGAGAKAGTKVTMKGSGVKRPIVWNQSRTKWRFPASDRWESGPPPEDSQEQVYKKVEQR